MASLFKEFSIELDLHKSAKAARKAKKHLLKHAIKVWFDEAEDLMKKKAIFPWSKPMTKKEALKATTYYHREGGELHHRVVTYWKEEIKQLNAIITLSKKIKEPQTISLKSDFASFLILFFEKE